MSCGGCSDSDQGKEWFFGDAWVWGREFLFFFFFFQELSLVAFEVASLLVSFDASSGRVVWHMHLEHMCQRVEYLIHLDYLETRKWRLYV